MEELYYYTVIPSIFSITSCILSISLFFMYQSLRDIYEFKFVIFLLSFEASDQILNSFPISILDKPSDYCKVEEFMSQILESMEAIWVCIISLLVYRKYYLDLGSRSLSLKKCLVVAIGISLPFAILEYIFDDFKPSSFECYKSKKIGPIEFFVFNYLFTYNFIFIGSIFNSVLVWKFKKRMNSLNLTREDRAIVNLLSYPYIMLLGYLPYFLLRCLEYGGQYPGPIYILICEYFYRTTGFIYSLFFVSNRKFRRSLSFVPGRSVDLQGEPIHLQDFNN